MKKSICVFLVIILCFSMFACSSESTLKETETLKIYLDSSSPSELMQLAIAEYKALYPDVKLEIEDYTALETVEYTTKLKTELLAGSGPDVIIDYFSFLSSFGLDKMVKSGSFFDIDTIIKADADFNFSDYNETILNAGISNGGRYLMPLNYTFPYILATESSLNEAGISENNFENIFSTVEALKTAATITDKPLMQKNSSFSYGITHFLSRPFAEEADGKISWNEELYRKAAESYKPLFEQLKFDDQFNNYSNFDPYLFLSSNQITAYLAVNDITVDTLFQNCAALSGSSQKAVYIPLKDENGDINATAISYAAIPNASKNKLNAWRFIKILLSDKIQQNRTSFMYIPVSNNALSYKINNSKEAFSSSRAMALDTETATLAALDNTYFNEFEKAVSDIKKSSFNSINDSTVASELVNFYMDNVSLDDAINEIKNNAQLYLTE